MEAVCFPSSWRSRHYAFRLHMPLAIEFGLVSDRKCIINFRPKTKLYRKRKTHLRPKNKRNRILGVFSAENRNRKFGRLLKSIHLRQSQIYRRVHLYRPTANSKLHTVLLPKFIKTSLLVQLRLLRPQCLS